MSEFALKTDPAERIAVASKKLGEEPVHVNLKLVNDCKDRCAFKVKCTSNELFRIRPPLGTLRTGDSATVAVSFHFYICQICLIKTLVYIMFFQLTFNAGKTVPESGKHYVAIYYIKIGDEKKSPRQFWQDHKGEPDGTKRLYVDFKKDDAGAAPVDAADKKDDEKKDDKKEDKKEDEAAAENKDAKKDDDKKDADKDDKKDDEKKDGEKKDEEKKE